jgi:hypothetical protein
MESTMHPVQFYSSSNGDRWLLTRGADREALVLHQANIPSGGALTRIAIADFLGGNTEAPECRALLRLIGSLVGDTPAADNDAATVDPLPSKPISHDEAEQVAVSR